MYIGRFCRNILRFGYRADRIGHDEEALFALIDEHPGYPALADLWDRFYDGPRIDPDQCGALAEELLRLKPLVDDPQLAASVDRIRHFFLSAHEKQRSVYCASD
jgi:hypothetical protein